MPCVAVYLTSKSSAAYFISLLALLNSRDALLGKFSGITGGPNASITDITLLDISVNENGTIGA